MDEVGMYDAMRAMLDWLIESVITFLSSAPGAYLWALVLIFFVVGLFFTILSALLQFFRERRL